MRKRIISFMTALTIMASLCTSYAVPNITPRWTFLCEITTLIDMTDDQLRWGATADCYPLSQVTHTGITIYLQQANDFGWYTIDSETVKMSGNLADAGGRYSDWEANNSYRIKVEVWAYQNNVKLEYAGPFYQYYNT